MAASAPFQMLLFRHPEDSNVEPFEEQIVRSFKGGKETGGYLATGEDLKIGYKELAGAHPQPAAEVLDAFCHSLVVVLVDRMLLKADAATWNWIADCWTHVSASKGRHAMIAFPMEESIGDEFAGKPGLQRLQVQAVQFLGERAIRPTMAALRVLHEVRVLLARGLALPPAAGQPPGFLRLFISHAKADGLPLAQALKNQIQSISWLKTFYDAEDLPAGSDWLQELENGVGSSLIIMLRTEFYDGRYWCEKEVRWADEYATPAVLVDARTALNHPASALPFGRVPTVRIPDGNLMRVLFGALREGVRFLLFARSVEEMKRVGDLPHPIELRVFCFNPSMNALLRACRALSDPKLPAQNPRMILYPDPPLGTGDNEAAQALVAAYAPQARLVTPQTLAAKGGSA
ncbi:MAG TPA: toll/interleukin-1 receptor domain-containing protein [Bradyrhizobium sp.]|nr:toll/interleukin-1 receptor domain-containing protein [Bradyrhizobium sp.]